MVDAKEASESKDLNEILIKKPSPLIAPSSSLKTPTCFLDRFLTALISWLPYMSFFFMAYSAVTAVYDSRNDPANLAFVFGSFTLLGLLYFSMWEFERTRVSPSPTKHSVLKVVIWILSVTLTAVFAVRVTTIVDSLALDIFVWTIATFTSACGFYFLFVMKPNA